LARYIPRPTIRPHVRFHPLSASKFLSAHVEQFRRIANGDRKSQRRTSANASAQHHARSCLRYGGDLDYAGFHGADSRIWSFATGDEKEIDALTHAFSVYRQNEGGTTSHGLATALIDKNGKIDKIWRGNAWAPPEVVQQINAEQK
jgi:hypothetical protein